MQDRNQFVRQRLSDGEYYNDAFHHYTAKYLYLTNVRAHFTIFALIMIIAVFVSFWTFRLDYAKDPMPFVIYAQDQVLYYPILKPLASKKEPIDTSAARYLVDRYIRLRENYDPQSYSEENKELLMQKIKALSSIELYYEYENFLNPESNNNSPILLYKNKFTRDINITKTSWFSDTMDGTGAEIEYDAIVTNKLTGETSASSKKLKIKYLLSDLSQNLDKSAKFYFAVTDYITY